MRPEPLKMGRASWEDPRSRSIYPLKQTERRLFVDLSGFQDALVRHFNALYEGQASAERLMELAERYLHHVRGGFLRKQKAVIGQTVEFLRHIFRFSWACGEAIPDEGLLLEILHATIWAYLQRYYRQSWDDLPEAKLRELEERAADLTHEVSHRIMWPDQP